MEQFSNINDGFKILNNEKYHTLDYWFYYELKLIDMLGIIQYYYQKEQEQKVCRAASLAEAWPGGGEVTRCRIAADGLQRTRSECEC